jgi:hypothetical protein
MLEKLSVFEALPPNFLLVLESGLVIGAVSLVFSLINKQRRAAARNTYPKDVVILHQFPRGLRAPSPSPFPLKLETWSVKSTSISLDISCFY